MEHYILANVRAFCAALVDRSSGSPKTQEKSQKDWSSPRNMTDWCSYLTFDVLGDLSFGKSFEMLGKDDNRFVVDLVNHAAHRHLIVGDCLVRFEIGDRSLIPVWDTAPDP